MKNYESAFTFRWRENRGRNTRRRSVQDTKRKHNNCVRFQYASLESII